MEETKEVSPEQILEKLETAIGQIDLNETSASADEYKITILVTTIAHGEKIILRHLKNLEAYEEYELELKALPWYTFVEKTYIYGYAPFGNICIFSVKPSDTWSRFETKSGIQKIINSKQIDTTNRNTFSKSISQVNADYINEPAPVPEKSTSEPRGAIMANMIRGSQDFFSQNMPVKGIMNPMAMRLEIVPSVYSLSGRNTDRIEEALVRDPSSMIGFKDSYSGIFVSILSDNRGNKFTFPSLFNLADGKHIMEIFQRLEEPIPDLNGSELYEVIKYYVDYWNKTYTSESNILAIKSLNVGYQIPDKTGRPLKAVSYFMLTQMNTMNVYVLANLVFDFLLSKKQKPAQAYTKANIASWVEEELRNTNSKIINISTACEAVNPDKMDYSTIEDVAAHINDNSLHQTETQNYIEEEGGPDLITYDELDEYISSQYKKLSQEPEQGTVLDVDSNYNSNSSFTGTKREREREQNISKKHLAAEKGGKRKTNKRKTNKRKTNKRKTNKRKTNKRKTNRNYKNKTIKRK